MNIPSISDPKHVENNLIKSPTVHVVSKDRDGPQGTKPRPTWKRITCMDCGPRVENTEEPIHVVGKRSSPLKARSGSMARLRMIFKRVKWQGCWSTLAEHNKAVSLALPRAWEPLDNS